MRPYKILTIISGILSFLSFGSCLVLHYLVTGNEADFWMNISLAIFGSALLTVLTSVVTYFNEKRNTMEGFVYHCKQLLHFLEKYQDSMTLEEKMKFYMDYYDLDKSAWDADFGKMDFFADIITGDRKYIYEKIYLPMLKFNQEVSKHAWQFRMYFDGSGINEAVMHNFVEQLELNLISRKEEGIPTEYDSTGNPITFCKVTSKKPKLVYEIFHELNGRYYNIMSGKWNKK